MKVAPESHFEIKPKRDPLENIPAEYHVPVTSGHSAPSEDSGHHHPPPGSIPTPVVIAQKIAEHQGGAGGVSLLTSMHLSHRRSIDSSTSSSPTSSPTTDHPVKQGPPTSAKPSRLPENINLLLGNREASQAVARSAANAQEIRAQRLASSSGNPMEGGEEGPAPHPEARPTPEPAISRDFRGQSMTVSPSAVNQPVAPNIVRSRTVSLPSTAPKPRMRPAPPSPDMKRKPKASFRPQGITVQFSGRGGTESRREALRKLGLLKDNSSS
uniref:Proline-rich protein n=1 Tax=Denticeps clupeoides TaxID=299321 RepID=A0AAY4E8J7_9TELE